MSVREPVKKEKKYHFYFIIKPKYFESTMFQVSEIHGGAISKVQLSMVF